MGMRKCHFLLNLVFLVVWCSALSGYAYAEILVNGTVGYEQFIPPATIDDAGEQASFLNMGSDKLTLENPSNSPIILDVLDLRNTDVKDVFKLISQKSGVNIVLGGEVRGNVTIYLRDVEVNEALRIIVDAYGWAFVQDGKILKVMTSREYETKYGKKFGREVQTRIKRLQFANPKDLQNILNQMKSDVGKVIADEKSNTLVLIDGQENLEKMEEVIKHIDVPVETEVFNLNYADADAISGKVSEILTPGLGTAKFDVRSNKVVISDTALKVEKIREIIEAFDQRDREVLIEAKILQVILSDEHKLGIDWEAVVSNFHNLDMKNSFSILSDNEKRGQLSIGTVATDGYTALVQALDEIGETKTLSSPRIMAVNNKEAKILVGSTEPYVTSTTTTPSSGPTTVSESVNFIEVGVKLFVTPVIHDDDFITMKIKPEISSVTSNVTTSNNNTIPVVETSEAETTIIVKDGVTIVIGGLIKEEKIRTKKKVPVLGSVPLLGYFFRNVDDYVRKTEIAIFLTPRITSGDVMTDKKNGSLGVKSLLDYNFEK